MLVAEPGGVPELQRLPSQHLVQVFPEIILAPPDVHSLLGLFSLRLVELPHLSLLQPLLQVA